MHKRHEQQTSCYSSFSYRICTGCPDRLKSAPRQQEANHRYICTFLRTKLLYPPHSPLSPVTTTMSTCFTGRMFTSGESTSSTLSLWFTPKSTCRAKTDFWIHFRAHGWLRQGLSSNFKNQITIIACCQGLLADMHPLSLHSCELITRWLMNCTFSVAAPMASSPSPGSQRKDGRLQQRPEHA